VNLHFLSRRIRVIYSETDVALILNPRLTVIELLATVCDELGIAYPADTGSVKILIDALNRRLLESHARGKRTVLIIDEAQNLQEDVLEQIRLLTNLETAKEKLLQIILIGQPELLSILKQQRLRQLSQRITGRYHLLPLSRKETYAYIQHRLLVSDRRDPLFTARAMRLVYRISGGVPRIINIICDRALLGAYALGKQRIGGGIVRKASRETRGIRFWHRRLRAAWAGGFLAIAVLIIGLAVLLMPSGVSVLRQKVDALMGSGNRGASEKASGAIVPDPPAAEALISRDLIPAPPKSTQAGNSTNVDAVAQNAEGSLGTGSERGANARLMDVLNDASLEKSEPGFAGLYRQWGVEVPPKPSDIGCQDARSRGFDCLFQTGSWLKLRRYNIPAILDIVLPNGVRRQVTIVGLAEDTATLAIGGRNYTVPLSEINQVWDGSFVILWKPPFAPRQLSVGDRGKEVIWIRHTLDVLGGKTPESSYSELFDKDLEQRVMDFQRSQLLIQDGYVGNETLIRLTAALLGSSAPSISRRAR
jgi:general secretion pathway protein A